jgi:hypothetical protein
MLQPFEPMKPVYINRLIKLKKFYLVSQTYKRGEDPFAEVQKKSLLLTDYSDIGLAKGHLQALGSDKYAAIIDLQKEEHLKKVTAMIQDDSGFAVYWAVVRSREALEEKINAGYSENMRRYIDNYTDWRPGRGVTIYLSESAGNFRSAIH